MQITINIDEGRTPPDGAVKLRVKFTCGREPQRDAYRVETLGLAMFKGLAAVVRKGLGGRDDVYIKINKLQGTK